MSTAASLGAFADSPGEPRRLAPAVRTGPRPAREQFYRPELDALRFFAFLIVFIGHLPVYYPIFTKNTATMGFERVAAGLVSMGSFGVDLFFVLSAYLITSLLLRERDVSGAVDVRNFYVRRVLRIWPLYFGFLALSILTAWTLPEFHVRAIYFFPFFLLLGNFAYPALMGSKILGLIGPLWSISVEEQFYLVWPNVVRYASREWSVRACLVMFIVSTCARLFSPLFGLRYMWENTFTRLDPIAIGILLAVALHPRVPNWRRLTRISIFCVGLSLWIVAGVFYGVRLQCSVIDSVIGYPLVAAGGGAILLATLGTRSYGDTWWWKVLVYLGQISYGLYVFHGMMMMLMKWAIEPTHATGFVIWTTTSLAATIVTASLSYRYYEKPFLRLKSRFACVPSRPV